jgi:hypothetical protein
MSTADIAAFMAGEIGALSDALCLKSTDDLEPTIVDLLLELGVSQPSAITDVRRARAFARVFIWRRVAARTAGDFNFAADGGRYDRSQVHDNAVKMAAAAEADASPFGWSGSGRGYVDEIVSRVDPYADRLLSMEEWDS